jgi:hypothetical protein
VIERAPIEVPWLADHSEVLAGQLPGRLDRFGAARGEEHPVEVARGERSDALGELDGTGVRIGPEREVGQLGRLFGRRLTELGPPVPDLAGEQPGQTIEVALAVLVPDVGALAAHHDRHLVFLVVRAEAGEVHPEVSPRPLAQGAVARVGRSGVAHLVPQV